MAQTYISLPEFNLLKLIKIYESCRWLDHRHELVNTNSHNAETTMNTQITFVHALVLIFHLEFDQILYSRYFYGSTIHHFGFILKF